MFGAAGRGRAQMSQHAPLDAQIARLPFEHRRATFGQAESRKPSRRLGGVKRLQVELVFAGAPEHARHKIAIKRTGFQQAHWMVKLLVDRAFQFRP